MTASVDRHEFPQVIAGSSEDDVVGRSPNGVGLWVSGQHRIGFEVALEGEGHVPVTEACPARAGRGYLDPLVSAGRVGIDQDTAVLPARQDITDREHAECELFGTRDAEMAETYGFSRGSIEKLGNLRRPNAGLSDAMVGKLTPRERRFLNPICSGLDEAAIARKLDLSCGNVRNDGAALYREVGVRKRGEAIVRGLRSVLLRMSPKPNTHLTSIKAPLNTMTDRTSHRP